MSARWTWARAALVALLAVLLAVLAHQVGGGGAPGAEVSFGAVAVLIPAAYPLLRRERNWPVIAGGLSAAELGLHALFTALTPGHSSGLAALLCDHGARAVVAPSGMFLGDPTPGGFRLTGATMAVAHLVATLLLAWWIRVGERTAYGFLRAQLRRWLPRPWTVSRPAGRRATVATRHSMRKAAAVPGDVGRRGPPRTRLALAASFLNY